MYWTWEEFELFSVYCWVALNSIKSLKTDFTLSSWVTLIVFQLIVEQDTLDKDLTVLKWSMTTLGYIEGQTPIIPTIMRIRRLGWWYSCNP